MEKEQGVEQKPICCGFALAVLEDIEVVEVVNFRPDLAVERSRILESLYGLPRNGNNLESFAETPVPEMVKQKFHALVGRLNLSPYNLNMPLYPDFAR